uniref:Alternative protein ZNF438 n=1 Tax=Homo sapiens TaxID=9606 RepID=L8EAU2_HUMAN|nr:alternative protein ZNF438 [Homo sapiens]
MSRLQPPLPVQTAPSRPHEYTHQQTPLQLSDLSQVLCTSWQPEHTHETSSW